MASLYDLNNEKTRYENLRKDINEIVSKLNNAIVGLDYPISNLENGFKIDDYSKGAEKLRKIKTDLESRRNYLSSEVIVSINNSISQIDGQIKREEQRLREEEEARLLALQEENEV